MKKEDSAFFQFGILPEICIHTPNPDEYSKSYIPRDKCECGSNQWKEDCTMILGHYPDGTTSIKQVHRCAKCNEVRMADHVSIFDEKNEDNLTLNQGKESKKD